MRVIAGRYKGRRLQSPAWPGLRPTSDRLKETLFNILTPHLEGAQVLDGYAGTGAIGIEAISRGASSVVFVERDPRAATLVEANLAYCGITNGCVMMRGDFEGALRRLPAHQRFDLVLLDPPYDEAAPDGLLGIAVERLAPGGLLVLEHATRRRAPDRVGALCCVRRVRSGASTLSLYRLAAPGAGVSDEETRLGATANQPEGLEES